MRRYVVPSGALGDRRHFPVHNPHQLLHNTVEVLPLLVRDATCAAGVRAGNAASVASAAPTSAAQDLLQIEVLIDQSRTALGRAVSDGDLSEDAAEGISTGLDTAEANLAGNELRAAANDLIRVCNAI